MSAIFWTLEVATERQMAAWLGSPRLHTYRTSIEAVLKEVMKREVKRTAAAQDIAGAVCEGRSNSSSHYIRCWPLRLAMAIFDAGGPTVSATVFGTAWMSQT